MKDTIFYEVTLSKTYKYPKSMLERGYENEDARNKAHQDVYKIINEISNNKFEKVNSQELFKTEIKENKGWKLRTEETSESKVNIEEIVEHFALIEIEKKFGILNIEENPQLFEFEEANPYSEIPSPQGVWRLKREIESEFSKIKQQHKTKLKKFYTNVIPNTPRPRRPTARNIEDRLSIADRLTSISGTSINTDSINLGDRFTWRPSGHSTNPENIWRSADASQNETQDQAEF